MPAAAHYSDISSLVQRARLNEGRLPAAEAAFAGLAAVFAVAVVAVAVELMHPATSDISTDVYKPFLPY